MSPSEQKPEQKPLSRVEQKRLKVKQEIIDTALELLNNQGVEKLTLAAVTEKLGLTKPAIYHYFRSKEALIRSLVLEITRQETMALIDAVSKSSNRDIVLGTLIRAFYQYYRSHLNAFRLVFCQFQLMDMQLLGIDQNTLREDVNPLSQRLFDTVVMILSENGKSAATDEMRQLAFSAWLAAIGLVDMIGTSAAANDPLRHSDDVLLSTLENVFNSAAERIVEQ